MSQPASLVVALAFLLLAGSAEAKDRKEPPRKARANPAVRSDACRARFEALCAAMQGCAKSPEDLGGDTCQAIDPGCARLSGELPASKAKVDACVSGLRKLRCKQRVDPSDLLDLESRVPECAQLALAEAESGRRAAEVARTATASR